MTTEATATQARTAAWANIGTSVDTTSIEDALKKCHLDWGVEQKPVTTVIDGVPHEIPGYVANVTTTGIVAGVVSTSYQVCQNRDAFEFAQYISNDMRFVKGGMTSKGMVYVIGEMPEQNILGDRFTPNVIFQNSFNGFCGVKAAIIPLRIICQNQFNMAFRESANTLAWKHSSGLQINMEHGKKTMKQVVHYMDSFGREAEKLATVKMDSAATDRFIDKFFSVRDDMTDRSRTMISNKREHFMNALNAEDNANFKGSVWGMINAYSDFLTHPARVKNGSGGKEEMRFNNNLADTKFREFRAALSEFIDV